MAHIIRSNGQVEELKPKDGDVLSAEEIWEVVEGFCEIVPLTDDLRLYTNENNTLLPPNFAATMLLWKFRPDLCLSGPVVGDMVIATRDETGHKKTDVLVLIHIRDVFQNQP